MAEKFIITDDIIETNFESKYINVYDIKFAPGRHYYDVTRHKRKDILALKSDEEFKNMTADAVTCMVVLEVKNEPPRLLLAREFRYPCGQFVLCPPAGLIDPADLNTPNPLYTTAIREIKEETGLTVKESDRIFTISPVVFSSPGMTDEANAIIGVVIKLDDLSELTQCGAEDSELFNGFCLVDENEAREIIKNGCDDTGRAYAVYAWCTLMYFISGMWK